MQKYDYIITGTGASGLMLAYHMVMDSFFNQKKILLIDKEIKNQNDRTWCFWEKEKGVWDSIISKEWSQVFFGSQRFSQDIKITPYQYKLIRSKDFYNFVHTAVQAKSNVTIVRESIIAIIDEGNIVEVETDQRLYLGNKVFNSVLLSNVYKNQQKYPVLNQHFIGWFVETKEPFFDSKTATFMDFTVDQKGNTRFMYVLPTSEKEALFEYTLFSEHLLTDQEYEKEIAKYLLTKGITDYTITEKEKGCIPMTCYEFRKHNSENVLHIGTAGGWTKPSTGFTFHNTKKKSEKLITFLKKNDNLLEFGKRTKFWYYDLLFLDLLYKENQNGAALFSSLFRKNKTTKILKFLDEETSFLEDLKIMATMPAMKFLRMICRRVFN
ncbi:lycopene cyclase family protein [Aquimarina sp. 2201CG14-23]|uniref:lycopene cyclase family protein n=1 Tax=Aquimarina mycalae TaxID=3040073 RepID=UPI002477DFC9|nr:lycopene cyclase family protein [Aquimarina sp. 2201CG14-23]MDH7447426.1 lycopene cyclase family protein [Aquimarina sp. 2201CG14-23]